MKKADLKYRILTALVFCIRIILVFMPFHAFLTVFASSGLGHYTALRLWKEVLLFLCGLAVIYLVLFDTKVRFHTLTRRLVQLILAYILVVSLTTVWVLLRHSVTFKAAAYGWLIDVRFLVFFLICWATAIRTNRLSVKLESIVLRPAAIVVIFGLLQVFLLPKDFLRHFGYGPGPNTIAPYQTINSNAHYVRIESTLRGVNALGNYLILVLSALLVVPVRKLSPRRGLYILAVLIVLACTFARAAWVGALLAILIIVALQIKTRSEKIVASVAVVVIGLGLVIALLAGHNNAVFQNVTLHTEHHSAIKTTSDQGHLATIKAGLKDIMHEPLGRGPGTAGPASVYNDDKPRLTEDYYIQLGQEVGIVGLLLFVVINVGVGALLWVRRRDPLALALFASLIGLSFANLLSPAWTDDTIAYIWWGLAGMAMAALAVAKQLPESD